MILGYDMEYLSGRFDTFPNAEESQYPGQSQTTKKIPTNTSNLLKAGTNMKNSSPESTNVHTCLLTN